LKIRRCFCRSYIHSGNKITLVALSKNIEGAEEVLEISMQAAAMSLFNESGVDAATIEKIEIAKDLLRQEGQAMLDNIAKVNLLVSLKIIP
jgi:translation elongation factor EF-Ts